jgi:hypothetical protein
MSGADAREIATSDKKSFLMLHFLPEKLIITTTDH